MQSGNLAERIERAKELLHTVRHAALATVNQDGSPHNSPVFSTFDEELNFYWASNPAAQHSQNVARDGRVFVVLFDSVGKGGGLYVKGQATICRGDELTNALIAVNASRKHWVREQVDASYYIDGPDRLYKAVCQAVWVNITDRSADGLVIREARHQISPDDLR